MTQETRGRPRHKERWCQACDFAILGFFSEYPLETASLDGVMAFENPMVLESIEAAMQMNKEN